MRVVAAVLVAVLASELLSSAQTRKPAPPRRAPAAKSVPAVTQPAEFSCPMLLGQGLRTERTYCDVPIGRDAASGVVIPFPPHRGPVTVSFDLHNRHTYSEELVKANRAYSKYTATIGVMYSDTTLQTRAFVQNEFRTAADLVDRIQGGSGPGGLKAVAPTGTETIVVEIPEEEQSISIVGEKLTVIRVDGTDTFIAPGRPIAVISNVTLTYRPGPAKPAPTKTAPTRPAQPQRK
ncbi:MAG TPA: hypothetical protein VFB85_20485 [Vicinamibacterales bacterium]|jgi:hypothetical protein|nr:hypothetical protein [Vicinamibacterales bacterium]